MEQNLDGGREVSQTWLAGAFSRMCLQDLVMGRGAESGRRNGWFGTS